VKTTFLVRDGLTKVVLHPETPVERAVLDLVQRGQSVEVHRAQFAETRGGFVRQFGLGGHSAVGSDHLPDLVLVLRPAEFKVPDVEPPPETADLCKLRDGTWVYRNHAGTWQPCPPPFPTDRSKEVDLLTATLRLVRDQYVVNRGDLPDQAALDAIKKICTEALGDRL